MKLCKSKIIIKDKLYSCERYFMLYFVFSAEKVSYISMTKKSLDKFVNNKSFYISRNNN